nr:hypothetical protein [Bradyrhizobium sp. URHD0069]
MRARGLRPLQHWCPICAIPRCLRRSAVRQS